MIALLQRWRRRCNRTDPQVAHLLWLHAAKVNRERGY
jgi:hypothetical protein